MLKKISYNTNLIYFVVIALFVVVRICSSLGLFSFMGDWAGIIMSFVTQIGLIFLLPLVLFKTLNKVSYKDTFSFFSYKKISAKVVVATVALGVIVFFLNAYVSSLFNSIIQLFGYKSVHSASSIPDTWWTFLLELVSTAVLPAICEETLHRGMLLKGNSLLGIKKSIILSGVLFGLLHLNIEQFFYATIIGLFLGYLCWMCNSIYPCMIIHFMNNGLSVFLSFAGRRGWSVGKIFTFIANYLSKNIVLGGIIFILFIALLVILGIELLKFIIKESFKYSFEKRQRQLANKAIRENYFKQIDDLKKDGALETSNFYKADNRVIYIDLKQFIKFVGKEIEGVPDDKNLGSSNLKESVIKGSEIADEQMRKIELKTKIFIWGALTLGVVVTFLTFIWGIIR